MSYPIEVIRTVVILCIAASFILSLLFTPLSMKVAHRIDAIDVPKDGRRMHKIPIPRFGGMAIFLSVAIMTLIVKYVVFPNTFLMYRLSEPTDKLMSVLAGGALIYIVGVIDDIYDLKAVVKLLCQIGVAGITFFLGIRIDAIRLLGLHFAPDTTGGILISLIVTVVWIVAITNTINLIDGMDGLAAGVAGIAALSIAYSGYIHGLYTVALLMCVVAGAALGFLPFNFYPAKTFMGDSGAMFLGFMLASVSVISPAKGATLIATIVPVLVLGVPIFDVLFAILRRIINRQPIFKPDKGHLHHQLGYMGMGQRRTVLMIYGISSVMGMAAIIFSRNLLLEAILLFIVALLFIFILIWDWNK
jgi:UDP-GlcNAc:undecaprenyl-phosphate GlcNAc-1-phosphate transferase